MTGPTFSFLIALTTWNYSSKQPTSKESIPKWPRRVRSGAWLWWENGVMSSAESTEQKVKLNHKNELKVGIYSFRAINLNNDWVDCWVSRKIFISQEGSLYKYAQIVHKFYYWLTSFHFYTRITNFKFDRFVDNLDLNVPDSCFFVKSLCHIEKPLLLKKFFKYLKIWSL